VPVQCRRKESSRSLSHLLMSSFLSLNSSEMSESLALLYVTLFQGTNSFINVTTVDLSTPETCLISK